MELRDSAPTIGIRASRSEAATAVNSMRCGGRRREVEVVGGAMPLAAGCGVMPRGDGGVMLPREDDGAMPSRGGGGAMPLDADDGGARPPSSWRVGAKPTKVAKVAM